MAVIGHRIDYKARMMDHDPFLIGVSASTPEGNGVLVHHASFHGRSVTLPSDFNLSTGNYYKNHPAFGLSSGTTGELHPSLFQAFAIAQRALDYRSSTCLTSGSLLAATL